LKNIVANMTNNNFVNATETGAYEYAITYGILVNCIKISKLHNKICCLSDNLDKCFRFLKL